MLAVLFRYDNLYVFAIPRPVLPLIQFIHILTCFLFCSGILIVVLFRHYNLHVFAVPRSVLLPLLLARQPQDATEEAETHKYRYYQ